MNLTNLLTLKMNQKWSKSITFVPDNVPWKRKKSMRKPFLAWLLPQGKICQWNPLRKTSLQRDLTQLVELKHLIWAWFRWTSSKARMRETSRQPSYKLFIINSWPETVQFWSTKSNRNCPVCFKLQGGLKTIKISNSISTTMEIRFQLG